MESPRKKPASPATPVRRIVLLFAALALLATACGSADDGSASTDDGEATQPVETAAADGDAADDPEPADDGSAADDPAPTTTEECDPEWEFCPTEADFALEDMGDFGLADIVEGPFTVNRDPASVDDFPFPCGPAQAPAGVARRQVVNGPGISLVSRALIIWESPEAIADYFATFPTETGCTQEFISDPLIEIEAIERDGWSGFTWSYGADGVESQSYTQIANGNRMIATDAPLRIISNALAKTVVDYLAS